MTRARPASVAIALAAGLFTVACMVIAMRVAGPITHEYNLGSVRFEVTPSFSGKAQIYVPLVGWQLEAPLFSAPYTIRAEPRQVSAAAVAQAAKGFRTTLEQTERDLEHAAIWTFVRAFLFALAGGAAAAVVIALLLGALQGGWGTALRAGAACFVLSLLLIAASALWLWQSLDINAFKRTQITSGHGTPLTAALRDLGQDNRERAFLQDLARLVARARRIDISVESRKR